MIADAYPEHDRISCSDSHLVNITPDGSGCHRCNALAFDKIEELKAQIASAQQQEPAAYQVCFIGDKFYWENVAQHEFDMQVCAGLYETRKLYAAPVIPHQQLTDQEIRGERQDALPFARAIISAKKAKNDI